MELSAIIPHIEALIFASDKPLTALEITTHVNNALGFIDDVANLDQIETAIEGINEKYNSEFYAFELKQSGGGWQFLTKVEYHKTVALLNGDKFIKKLSTAALETLAIIAYKQPITKSEMEAIRGVNCDYAVQKLLEKDLVIISGRNEEAVGKPLIYATSKSFMDYFGINSADELPKISEVLMEQLTQATAVSEINREKDAAEQAELDEKASKDEQVVDDVIDAVLQSQERPELAEELKQTDEQEQTEEKVEEVHSIEIEAAEEETTEEKNAEDQTEFSEEATEEDPAAEEPKDGSVDV